MPPGLQDRQTNACTQQAVQLHTHYPVGKHTQRVIKPTQLGNFQLLFKDFSHMHTLFAIFQSFEIILL